MKKILFLITVVFLGISARSTAQVNGYSFSQSSGTYTAITGGVVLGTSTDDDGMYIANALGEDTYSTFNTTASGNGFPIGFTFYYEGNPYSNFAVSSNGYIVLGNGLFTIADAQSEVLTQFDLFANPNAQNRIIAGLASDLNTNGGQISYLTIGTAPNRALVVQYSNVSYSNGTNSAVAGAIINFQIRLKETSNIIDIVYGTFNIPSPVLTANMPQVGLNGTLATDYICRTSNGTTLWATSTAGGSNTAKMNLTTTDVPASGLTFTFSPPASCSGTPVAGTATATPNHLCSVGGSSIVLNVTGYSTDPQITFQWEEAFVNVSSSYISSGTGSGFAATTYTTLNQTADKYYRCKVTCTASGLSSYTNVVQIVANYANCYPIPVYTGCSGTSIENTTLSCTTLNNSTPGCNQLQATSFQGYDVVPSTTGIIKTNYVHRLSVTTNVSAIISVWIDYNRNFIYETSEWYQVTTASVAGVPSVLPILIPSTASVGKTGMRIRICNAGQTNDATMSTASMSSGEAEDYEIEIQTGAISSFTPIITGPTTVCPTSTGLTYSVISSSGNNYSWTVNGGASITAGNGTSSITVTWGSSSGTVTVAESGCALAISNGSLNVGLETVPSAPVMSGNFAICASATGINYSVPNVAGTTFAWTVSGGTLTSGQGTSSIDVDWGASGGSVSVTATNCVGTSPATNRTVFLKLAPGAQGITGPTAVCPNAAGVVYNVSGDPGSTFTWSITGGTITATSLDGSSATVTWGPSGGTLSTVESNCVGPSTLTSNLTVSLSTVVPSTPAAISGLNAVCPNEISVSYSVTNNPLLTYTWTITGGTQTSGGNTSAITVDWGASGGTVTVAAVNCIGASIPASLNVSLGAPAPVTPSISGITTICPNATGMTYSVTNTPGHTYAWTVTGGTQVSGTNTNSIVVNWGASPTQIQVVESNCAGAGSTSSLTINPNTITPITPSITGNIAICPNATGVAYSVVNTPGDTYSWNITGGTQMTGGTSNAITVNWGATGGVVSVTENNCAGAGSNSTLTVSLSTATPVTPVVNGLSLICPNATSVGYNVSNTAGSTYAWTISGGTQISGGSTNAIIVNWGATGGTVSVVESNCAGAGTTSNLTVSLKPAPNTSPITGVASRCHDTNGTYSVVNTAGNTYSWSVSAGTSITGGSTASSASFAFGTVNATLTLTESNSCGLAGAPVSKTIVVNNPAAPTVTSPIEYELNASASPLSAVGTALLWYTVATGGTGSSTAPTPLTNAVSVTTYYVSQTVATCVSPRALIEVNVTAVVDDAIAELSDGTTLNLYPNPTSALLNIRFVSNVKTLSIRVLNVTGKEVYSDDIKEFSGKLNSVLDLTDVSKGVYFIQFTTEKDVVTRKVILN